MVATKDRVVIHVTPDPSGTFRNSRLQSYGGFQGFPIISAPDSGFPDCRGRRRSTRKVFAVLL